MSVVGQTGTLCLPREPKKDGNEEASFKEVNSAKEVGSSPPNQATGSVSFELLATAQAE